jgi:hypothetical protein
MAAAVKEDIVVRLQTYAGQPLALAQWRWKDLYSPSEFEWQHGVTPASHVLVVCGMVAAYVAASFLLQHWMKSRERFGGPGPTLRVCCGGGGGGVWVPALTPCSRLVRADGPIFKGLVILHNAILSLGSLVMVRVGDGGCSALRCGVRSLRQRPSLCLG